MLPQQMGADDMFNGALVELRSYDGSVKLILLRVWRKKLEIRRGFFSKERCMSFGCTVWEGLANSYGIGPQQRERD